MKKKLVGKLKSKMRKRNALRKKSMTKNSTRPYAKRTKRGDLIFSDTEGMQQDKIFREMWNNAPTMIHEDDFVPMNCVLCGAEMLSIHDTHNPEPLTDRTYAKEAHETGNPNRCCSKCDVERVIPARLKRLGYDPSVMKHAIKEVRPLKDFNELENVNDDKPFERN